MPDLILHPEHIESRPGVTGFRLPPE